MSFAFLHGSGGGRKPVLFTPSLSIDYNTSVMTITDSNGDFADYEIYAEENGVYTLKTTTIAKNIDLTVLFPTHNEDINIKVKAIGTDFVSSDFSNVIVWQYGLGTEGLAYKLSEDGTHYICSGIGSATATDIEIGSIHEDLLVTEIEGAAFQNNTSITSVKIPDTVKSFTGGYVFAGCTSLRSVNIGKGFEDFSPWSGTFEGCSNLENVSLNNNIKNIGYSCFSRCKISIIDLPNKLLSVSASAFLVGKLIEIVLPDTVNYIGNYAFQGNQMTKATILATTPPTLGGVDAFSGSYPIYVPAESVEAYKAATNWASLASRIQAIQE